MDKVMLTDPSISPYPYLYFTNDRDPTSTEPVYIGYPDFIYFWYNTTSKGFFACTDNAANGSLVWEKIVTSGNISSIIMSNGWKINTSRSYSLRSSPAFNTSYLPSATNDTMVSAIVSLTSTLLTAGTVQFQIDTGSGFTTIGQSSISGIAANNTETITCLVPLNSHYKLINSSGSASITSINEIQL